MLLLAIKSIHRLPEMINKQLNYVKYTLVSQREHGSQRQGLWANLSASLNTPGLSLLV